MKRKLGRHLSLFFYSFHFCFPAPVPTLIDIRPASTSIYCLVNPTLSGYAGPQRFLFSSIGKTLDAVRHIGTHSFVIQLDLWVDGNNKSRSVYTSITRSPAFLHWSRSWRTLSLRKWNKEVFFFPRSTFDVDALGNKVSIDLSSWPLGWRHQYPSNSLNWNLRGSGIKTIPTLGSLTRWQGKDSVHDKKRRRPWVVT